MPDKPASSPLTQLESQMVTDYLREKGIEIKHWRAVCKLRPAQVAKKFKTTEAEIIQAARRPVEEKEKA